MSTENQVLIILALLAVLVSALAINYSMYKREEAAKKRRLQIKKIQGMVPDLLECLGVLKQTQCSPNITQLIENYASELIDEMAQLAANPELMQRLQAKTNGANMAPDANPINNQQVQVATNKSMTILRMLHNKKQITEDQLKTFTADLAITKVLFDAEGLIALCNGLIAQEKKIVAKTHLRTLKSLMTKIPESDNRKTAIKNAYESVVTKVEAQTPATVAPAPTESR